MSTVTSTVYCEDPKCQGHVRTTDYPGKRLVLTDDPALPLVMEDDQ